MTTQRKPRLLLVVALLALFGLIAASCGGSDSDTAATSGSDTAETSDADSSDDDAMADDEDAMADEDAMDDDDAMADEGEGHSTAGLASCPNPLVIQTDWFPEPEHGALYNLTAGEGSIDPESGRFSGPMAADPSITVEIRAGGPFIGFQQTVALMATDDDIFLGYVNTDEAIANYADFPTTAVVAPLEVNPQMIMWDPDTYDINSWDDVRGTGAVINVFAGAAYTEYLVGVGLVDEDQIDPSYDGGPARFIAEAGNIIQQGFASQEPFNYENVFTDWGKPVDQLLIHDSGLEIYQGAVAILDSKLDDAADECLTSLVPLLQQSAVDFQEDPAATNAAILQAVVDLDSFWQLSEASVANTVMAMTDLGLVSNGPDGTLGNFDLDRVSSIIALLDEQVATMDVPAGLSADDLVTNKYIDPSIGFAGSVIRGGAAPAGDAEPVSAGNLGDCPSPLVIQTDWFPEPEHGALYNLTAGEGSIDPESGRFSGPLAADPSITVEIRAGGPFIGFQQTVALMATDDDIFLGYVNTDEAISNYADFPTTAVVAPLEINPQMVMWDPDTYDISSWDDVKGTGAVINTFAGASYTEWLVGAGIVDEGQLDPSYDGGPARFIAEGGNILQQGFASQEPFNYENIFTDWGKPVDFLLIHDSGFPIYQGAVAILDSKLDDTARSCLAALVPVIQQSAVDFQNDPGATNAAILQAVVDLDSFWQLTEESVANTVRVMTDLGLVANGPDNTLGNFELDRVNDIIKVIDDQVGSIDVPEGLTAEDLVTNEFIDPSIGMG
jgi:hypothetical protein